VLSYPVEGREKKEEGEKTGGRRGHTNLQAAHPKYTYYPSFSSDYTEPFHNSITSDPTSIALSTKR